MGGTALLIPGDLPASRVAEASRGGWLSRMLGINRLRSASLGNDQMMLSLPPGRLKALREDFLKYLKQRLPYPWSATRYTLDYIRRCSTIYLRATKRGEQAQWYVQYSLSGCAGMAEISAEVGYHWLCLWYASEKARLNGTFFEPMGFAPLALEPDPTDLNFIPVGDHGYAAFQAQARPDRGAAPALEMDIGAAEAMGEEKAQQTLDQMARTCAALLEENNCLCQLCRPDLKLPRSDIA